MPRIVWRLLKESVRLAIAVLEDEGLLVKDGDGYLYAGHKSISLSEVREVGSVVVAQDWIKSLATKSVSPEGEYNPKTPEQRILAAYKIALGIPWDHRGWDKDNYSKWSRAAGKLLRSFSGDDKKAGYWLQDFAREMKEKDLSWNLATAAERGWATLAERENYD